MKNSKRTILLLNPPGDEKYLRDYYCSHASKANYYWQPYDLFVLGGVLKEHHRVYAIDAIIDGLGEEETIEKIRRIAPDTIIFLTGVVSWDNDFRFLERLLKETGEKYDLIGLGDILLNKAEYFMDRFPFLSAILYDFRSPSILDYLGGKSDVLAQMIYRSGDKILDGKFTKARGGFEMATPDFSLWNYKKYRIPHGRRLPFAGILTDFGCPFHCSYCLGGELGYAVRSISNINQELDYLKSIGIRELWIKDLTFGANRKHTEEFLRLLIDEEYNFSWVCISRVNVLDREILELMKRTGCHTIQLGVETADEETLEQISKGITKEQVRKVFGLCGEMGIRTLAHFMLGIPGDTPEKIERTIKYAIELDPEFASFNIATPRMGTQFRAEAVKKGWVEESDILFDNSQGYPVIETEWLDKETLWNLRKRAILRFYVRPHYIIKRIRGIQTLYEASTLITEGWSLLKSAFRRK